MWHPIPNLTIQEYRDFDREFKRKARFLVDENMDRDVALLLMDFGYNSVFVGDLGLVGAPDETVFASAWKERRIILTHDRDFLNDTRFPFHRNPGVIVLPGAEGDGALEKALADLLRISAPYGEAHRGAKIEVTQDRIWRVRGFLKSEGRHVQKRIRLEKNGQCSEWRVE
jgi:predicted nuclease of predicted toxin-antitoxin system